MSRSSPKVLFLVHVEEQFYNFFPDDLYTLRVLRSAMARKYDRVIVLDSGLEEYGGRGYRGVIHEIADLGLETWGWSWGYEKNMGYDDDPEEDWVIESRGHEWTWIPTELRDEQDYFASADIYIGGGCNYECLADWESVLDYLYLPYRRVEGLIF